MKNDTPRTDAVLNTFNGKASKLAADLATHAEELERELAAVTKELDEARGQRDRLAEAIQDAIDCRMIPITSANEGGAAKYSIQVRTADKLREALKALTTNQP